MWTRQLDIKVSIVHLKVIGKQFMGMGEIVQSMYKIERKETQGQVVRPKHLV